MLQSHPFPSHLAWPGAIDGRRSPRKRTAAISLLGLLTAAVMLLMPTLARADTSSTLTVVGTSDVNDSGLIPNLISPEFEKAYPQFTFKYAPSATGAAIQAAESGTGGPSALIVHAASLENQFVGGGFSYNNQYGNAIFTNDFVLAGPTGDPAGVSTNGANNVAQGFADIAAAGAAGKATFLTRGGTNTASGTTVEEHEIWGLVNSSGLTPSGVVLCTVSAADGGGMSPISSTVQSTSGQPCPASGTVNGTDAPSWYFVNAGASQGANVIAANACTVGTSGANTCYVLTDRGTFDYLSSGTDPAGSIPNLKIVTRGPQSASAPGGTYALINYFHVYIINPSKPGETVNLTAAKDFVNFLTSPSFQSQLKSYLPTADPAGPPFVADASPILTASGIPRNYYASKPVTVKGTLTNAEIGYPVLAGKTVTVDEVKGTLLIPVAHGKTNSKGAYSIKLVPPTTGSYEVSTGQISQIENATLSPPYGDLLSPSATAPVKVTVHSAVLRTVVQSESGRALVYGTVSPGTGHVRGTVAVLAHALGAKGGFKKVASERLRATQGNYAISAPLGPGRWRVRVRFQDPNEVVAASSPAVTITIAPRSATAVSLRSKRAKRAALTVHGSVSPVGSSAGTKVELLALNTAPGASARFKVLKTVTLHGKTSFALHAKLKRKTRWVLQLKYIEAGQLASFSGLKTVAVN
jgi:tungstate transport system substrate-binding protein